MKNDPLNLTGELLNPGYLVMGEDNTGARKHVKIDNTPDFDKNS